MKNFQELKIDDEEQFCDLDEGLKKNLHIPSLCVSNENKLLLSKGGVKKEHKSLFLAELQKCWSYRNKSCENNNNNNNIKEEKKAKKIEERRAKFVSASSESRKTSFGSFGTKKEMEFNKSLLKSSTLAQDRRSPCTQSRSKFYKSKKKIIVQTVEKKNKRFSINESKIASRSKSPHLQRPCSFKNDAKEFSFGDMP